MNWELTCDDIMVKRLLIHNASPRLSPKTTKVGSKESNQILHCFPTASQITKDNPSFSMVNDSDEDVIYGSEEDESKTPLNLQSTHSPRSKSMSSKSQLIHHDESD
jgi:hypothetical protein